jgi:Holliday junction resolvase
MKLCRPEPAERAIQNAIAATLRYHGWMVVRFNGGGFTDARGKYVKNYIIYGMNAACGFPDLAAFKDDRFLLIEVKTRTGKLSDQQERFHRFAALLGVRVHVLRNASEVEGIL